MSDTKTYKIFGLVLLAAALLYLPALPLTNELTAKLPKKEWQLRPPEIGVLPFLAIYWGAIVASLLLWLKGSDGIIQKALWVALGGVVQGLLLPVLGRGWEGFLLWFNPALLLVTLVIAGLGLVTGAVWGIACSLALRPNLRGDANQSL